jgi:CheY-like chemotaxis protein/HPt (histidine-containing phosphotransfer) domain-containing protein
MTLRRPAQRLILVAEDDAINQQVIQRQLAMLGFAADLASDGCAALACWERRHYAMILTDLHMPRMDGYALARTIRVGESGRARTPIVALTANAVREDAQLCRAAGMDDCLGMPVQLGELQAALVRWLPAAGDTSSREHRLAVAAADSTQPIEPGVLSNLVGGDHAIIRRITGIFRASLPQVAAEIREGCCACDMQRVTLASHRLKSSARSIGALRLGQLCVELERASLERETGRFAELLLRFEAETAAVMARLEAG